jgi:DNA-binding protein YbaB
MLDKIGQIKKLKNIHDSLVKEIVEVERDGLKIVINGKMEIKEIKLNESMPIKEQEILIKDLTNEAFHKIQKLAAQKISFLN